MTRCARTPLPLVCCGRAFCIVNAKSCGQNPLQSMHNHAGRTLYSQCTIMRAEPSTVNAQSCGRNPQHSQCTVLRAEPSAQSMHDERNPLAQSMHDERNPLHSQCTVLRAEPSAQSMHDERNPLHSQCTVGGTLCTVNTRQMKSSAQFNARRAAVRRRRIPAF